MVNTNFPVPNTIPGRLITDRDHLRALKQHLGQLCSLNGAQRFPGSQPVSFTYHSLDLLESEDFWVCEKSDGVRVMALVVIADRKSFYYGPTENGKQEVYFINRRDEFFLVDHIAFPHYEHQNRYLKDTIIDGELVIDVEPKIGQVLRFLVFDCIALEGQNLMHKPLNNRYGRLKDWVIAPLKKMLAAQPHLRNTMPFDVKLKSMELAYGIEKVLLHDLPKLTHGNDGLIFTSACSPYRIGTDPKILKWKPPSENSIDFRLELRFPPRADDPTEADFFGKPIFVLMMNCGNDGETFFDTLEMSDQEWHERKLRREQLDNRVVEVVWNSKLQTWKILRFRDDKKDGNYRSVVYSIIQSIQDGVEADELSKRAIRIKQAWKARAEGKPNPNAPIASAQRKNASGNQQKPKHSGGIQGGDPSTRGKFVALPSMPVPGTMACRLKRV
ncbi:uncharacterized protein MELLADRAFT_45847 [Melampsora larici-populina 98AG31]|uniref:mRNA guanylyltransferase n=1 Tax=Melampsora larici-populina (strain 98AG31 / pathotype 3-4-7) TaxID=747676 RepID=F4S8N6_MELLP|nr:uncharacterized protein MELLADRAFT_45847 [Melampsora larici-populina 98AG31]EGF98994.1 hypothetical protein MELLADRAFT_45847 [Melampsora larici-populina 98AG31]